MCHIQMNTNTGNRIIVFRVYQEYKCVGIMTTNCFVAVVGNVVKNENIAFDVLYIISN